MTTAQPGQEQRMEHLDEFDKAEWFDVMKRVRPQLSRVEFDELWGKFQGDKRRRSCNA